MNLCKPDCGYSEPRYQSVINVPVPSKSTPEKKKGSRYTGKIKVLDSIWLELRSAQVDSLVDGNVSCLPSKETALVKANGFRIDCTQFGQIHKKSHQRIISIRNLFSNTPKFQKHFARGVFLSCLIYCEDKVLVTFDDLLPTFQIDEDLNSSFQNDFHWLHKISSVWIDVRFLKNEMEKCDSATTLLFRLKMLQTIVTMQEALDLRDLGKVYYKPLTTDNNNVTFICTVIHLRSPKLVSAPNVRWIPVEKLKTRSTSKSFTDHYEVLSQHIQHLMIYHQMCNMPLGKGLYLGYFKLVSSVDLLKLLLPEKTPSILPHVKVRNNAQVTKEEWELLESIKVASKAPQKESSEGCMKTENNNDTHSSPPPITLSEIQNLFRQQLDSGLKKLFSNLKIDRKSALNHRFYTTEVVEISSSVSFIVLMPPPENVCVLEGDLKDKWTEKNKLMTLPIQIFEITHWLTYHNTLARRYMRLSTTLEIETALAQHNRRKAFSSEEMSQAQHQLNILSNLQTKLDSTWKDCRWIFEVVKAARARDKPFVTLRDFLNRYNGLSPLPQTSSTDSSSPLGKKFSKGTYVNGSPFLKLQQKKPAPELLILPDLPGPPLPSNPNFKYESCSSLPIVSTISSANYEKLRCSASLFNLKGGSSIGSRHSADGLSIVGETATSSVMQELDSYMRHTSSRSKLVSLSTMTNKFRDGDRKDSVPGADEPGGLRTISWKKQRGSLDRCFDQPMMGIPLLNSNSSANSNSSRGSQEIVLEEEDEEGNEVGTTGTPVESRVVEIYAAYECGLSSGTCVRLKISDETTTRQIVELLVYKLNEEVKTKALAGPLYDSIEEFCLVSVIGARERVLRMDCRPLTLQKPWDCARLFVRKKRDVTAAVSLESSIMNLII